MSYSCVSGGDGLLLLGLSSEEGFLFIANRVPKLPTMKVAIGVINSQNLASIGAIAFIG
jgi:hypothetical protein